MTGIEPAYSAWEADVLPLNYIRSELQTSLAARSELPCAPVAYPERVFLVVLGDEGSTRDLFAVHTSVAL